jgi:hypothetical protein
MSILIRLKKNSKGEIISFVVDDKYEIRPDGKVYSPKFVNQELKTYPDDLFNKDIKNLIEAIWKS